MSTEIEIVQKALVDINAVSAGLALLGEEYGGVVYEVTTTKGMEDAKAARAAIRDPRYNVEAIRKAAKKPILDLGKKLDAEAARITTELLKLEEPIDAQIKSEESRKEREREARIAAELARVERIDAAIENIRKRPTLAGGKTAAHAREVLAETQDIVIDESFEEKTGIAREALATSLAAIAGIVSEREAFEAEQVRIRAEREELAQLRAEAAQREAADRVRREEVERAAKKIRDEEYARAAEERRAQKAEDDRVAAERKAALDAQQQRIDEARASQEAEATAERARLASEAAEIERRNEALRKVQEPPPAPTRRGEAMKIPTSVEIVRHLAEFYRAHPDTIIEWLRAMDLDKVAKAA